jgi:hypothetical protein
MAELVYADGMGQETAPQVKELTMAAGNGGRRKPLVGSNPTF